MPSATSFLSHFCSRPPGYRTPSPPRRAVEPLSPSTTTDFRSSWKDRDVVKAATPDRVRYSYSNGTRPRASESDHAAQHHRSGHGRSSSTIDTLATIALATSPTFTPMSYRSQSQGSLAAVPLFAPDLPEPSERPAKRPRFERDPSPPQERKLSYSEQQSHQPFIPDSMKTDAELLLNFARPINFPPVVPPAKRVSIDESYRSADESKRRLKVEFAAGRYGRLDTEKPITFQSVDGVPQPRMRSQSDGSGVTVRPTVPGVRPNTSSSTLAPTAWQDERTVDAWNSTDTLGISGRQDLQSSGSCEVQMAVKSKMTLPKVEEDAGTDDAGQASCAACNLVRMPVDTEERGEVSWISCDGCKRWFHIVCAGFKNDREVRTVDKFICRSCRPIYGQTTFVRKSSRARTAIDYAGLNQGLVKTATDAMEHHYIEPIKQGKIQFLPDTFPRMWPELVTAEYFERGSGMTEPIIIPASWNSRQSVPSDDVEIDALAQDAPFREMFDELLEHVPEARLDFEEVIDCGQDALDMVIPAGLTVRTVAELYGPEERVEVIDVKSQQGEDKRWTMQRWADYYESGGSKVVRNVISLEISQSKLGRLIRRPKVVRDLDLQDSVWPPELKAIGEQPKVQFYCLMSVADCFTDFHIDFGGSSVYYHILKGKKTFFFIPPKDKHLKKYEEWCNSPAQDTTFLGDHTKECYRVDLSAGDTMLIPSGWIHAVWTPEDSLVIGGNFLTRLNYGMQIKVLNIEKDTKVPRKFRYPFFQKIQWYTALKYLEEDPIPDSVNDAFTRDEKYRFHRKYPIYYEFGDRANTAPPGSPYHNSRFYSQAELEGLPDLTKYLLRTALIAGSYNVEGVTAEQRNAVRKSIPRGQGDPIDTVRKFGIWVAWKRGNEQAPQWTRPGVIETNPKISLTEKRPAGRPSRRSERHADNQRMYTERQAVQRLPDGPVEPQQATTTTSNSTTTTVPSSVPSDSTTPVPVRRLSTSHTTCHNVSEEAPPTVQPVPRSSGLGPKRVACDACRKRRIRCRHKDGQDDLGPTTPYSLDTFDNGISLQQQHSLAHDAASALSSLAAIASEAGFQDLPMFAMDGPEMSGTHAAAFMTTPNSALRLEDMSPEGLNSKKGRSKACEDCRKSKRRCIHDVYGRIDPVKAQERSKPRATNATKRPRSSDEVVAFDSKKKPKQGSPSPSTRPAYLDPALVPLAEQAAKAAASGLEGIEAFSGPSRATLAEAFEAAPPMIQSSYASPPAYQSDATVSNDVESTVHLPTQPTATLVSPPTSLADETDASQDRKERVTHVPANRKHALAAQTPTVSRQPRHVERLEPEVHTIHIVKEPDNPPSARRASFGGSGTAARKSTPKKSSSRPSSSHSKTSASPMTERKADRHAPLYSISPSQSSKTSRRTVEPEGDVDAESMRLIRELQEQDFGLRKRSTRI